MVAGGPQGAGLAEGRGDGVRGGRQRVAAGELGEALGLGLLRGLLLRLLLRGGGLGLGLAPAALAAPRGGLLRGGGLAAACGLGVDLVLLLLGLLAGCGRAAPHRRRWRPASVSAVVRPALVSGVVEPLGVLVRASEIRASPRDSGEPTDGRSGREMETGGLPAAAVAMPPAPTAAMTPTPRTVELRASPRRAAWRRGAGRARGEWTPRWGSTPPRGPRRRCGSRRSRRCRCSLIGANGASGAGRLDATWAHSFPSFSPTGLADGFGAGRSPTRVHRRAATAEYARFTPSWWFPGSLAGFGACARSRLL